MNATLLDDRLRVELGRAQRAALRLRALRSQAVDATHAAQLDRKIKEALDEVWRIEGEIDRQNRRDSDF